MFLNIHHYLLLAVPLLGAATASNPTAPSTGAIVALLELQGLANWTADADGAGQQAYFSTQAWEAAEAQAIANLQLGNITSHDEQPGQNRRGLIQSRKDGDLPDGVSDSGGTRHAAHWYCYGSGSGLYTFALPLSTVNLCSGAAEVLKAAGTGHWVWTAAVRPNDDHPIDPGNTARQIYVKAAKWAGTNWGVAFCNTMVSVVINKKCQAPERKRNTVTQGGHVDVYAGKVGDWDRGKLTMQFSVSIENK